VYQYSLGKETPCRGYIDNGKLQIDSLKNRFMVIRCGIVDQFTVFGEARAVAGAIPGMLGFVIF
jgi:hypothetical protein